MRIDCAIFDMDDVLCDYKVELRISTLAAFANRTPDEVRSALWDTDFFDLADRGQFSAIDYLAEFGRRLRYPITKAQWIHARRVAMPAFVDVLLIVRRLKAHIPVALLTNNDHLVGETIALLFPELPPLFAPHVYVSAALGIAKPDPNCFRLCCDQMGVVPERAFFTDDRLENIVGARKAGLHAHHFKDANSLIAALEQLGLPSCSQN